MADFSTPSTAIDLSRLPAPTFAAPLSFAAVRAELVDYLQLTLPEFDATVASDPAVKLLEVVAWRELVIRQEFNDQALQIMLAYAAGANLDQLGALVNVERLLIEPADGATPAVYESDVDLRRRIQLAPESFSVAGPATAYRFHALGADPTIADALASSPAPGQVLLAIMSRYGSGVASPSQIAAVEAAVATTRPLTDQVTVVSVELLGFNIQAALVIFPGPDSVVVRAAAEARLAAYLADARQIGRAVTRSGIIAALHVEGVMNVILAQPAADILPDSSQIANCTGTIVTVADD